MFEKKIDIYKKKDKATWIQIKTALKEGGLTGFKAGHYLQESVMAGGCGAKLDPRELKAAKKAKSKTSRGSSARVKKSKPAKSSGSSSSGSARMSVRRQRH